MNTTTETSLAATPVPLETDDPYRYGWRHVRHEGPDGAVTYDQIPLSKEDLLFPEEGDFVVHTDGHNNDCLYLKTVLRTWASERDGFLVLSDHRVDWQFPGLRPLGPDVAVFGGLREAWDPWRGTFPVVDFGAKALLVVEVTSPDTRGNDLGVKVDFYQRVGVAFYAIVDRHKRSDGPDIRLLGYRNTPTGYEPVSVGPEGRLWLESVRLWLGIEGEAAVCYDEKGDKLKDHAELAQDIKTATEARQAAEARSVAEVEARETAESRIRQLEAELQRLRTTSNGGSANPPAS